MNIKYFTLSILLSVSIFFGCRKFVEVGVPQNRIVAASTFSTNGTACAAMAGLYTSVVNFSTLTGFPYEIAFYCGIYGDEMDAKQPAATTLTAYTNNLQATNSPTNVFWTNSYNYIYQANSILEGLQKSTGVTDAVKNQLRGEAFFMRAFWHFYLLNLYGDVPLVTSTDYSINGTMPRRAASLVYDQMVKDLQEAKTLLTSKYVGGDAVTETTDRVRINNNVAAALLARIYLYREQWQQAETEATDLINNPIYRIESIATTFKRNSKEAIWQLDMPAGGVIYNTWEANNFIIASKPTGSTERSASINDRVLNKFSSTDLRKINWIGSFTDVSVVPNVTYIFPTKYKSGTSTIDEASAVFRLAEIYLIRAEARAKQNKLSESIEDLDKIKQRAGIDLLKNTNPSIGKDALLDEIMSERERELFCEYGHRWFDLKRTRRVDEVMNIVAPQKSSSWSPSWAVWPIPQNDINNNRQLIQNKDYN